MSVSLPFLFPPVVLRRQGLGKTLEQREVAVAG